MNVGAQIAKGIKRIVDLRKSQGRSATWADIQPEVEDMANRVWSNPKELPACPACSQPPFLNIYPNFTFAHRSSTPESKRYVFFGCRHAQRLAPNFSMMTESDIDIFETRWRASIRELFDEATSHYTEEQKSARAKVLEIDIAPVISL